jgi:hypothetical protein
LNGQNEGRSGLEWAEMRRPGNNQDLLSVVVEYRRPPNCAQLQRACKYPLTSR